MLSRAMTIVAVSQDFPVRMTALGHLVFILAFVGITRAALIVPFWQHLPEAPRQQKMEAKTASCLKTRRRPQTNYYCFWSTVFRVLG